MHWTRWCWILPLAIACPAFAGEPTARELFDDARRSMNDGDYAAASKMLEQALHKQNGRGIKFQLAVCYEKLGRTASARALYLQVAGESHEAQETDREEVARTHAEQLERRVARLRIVVAEPSDALVVRRDDEAVTREAWGAAFAIDPGDHVVRAEAAGHLPWETRLKLAEGEDRDLAIPALSALPPKPVKVDVVGPLPRPKASNPWRTPALISGGVGLGILAAGGVMTAISASTYGTSSQYCDMGDRCTSRGVSLRSDALTYGDIATGLFITGAVVLAVSGIVWLWNPGSTRPSAAALAF